MLGRYASGLAMAGPTPGPGWQVSRANRESRAARPCMHAARGSAVSQSIDACGPPSAGPSGVVQTRAGIPKIRSEPVVIRWDAGAATPVASAWLAASPKRLILLRASRCGRRLTPSSISALA
jgi:hypothetical protein